MTQTQDRTISASTAWRVVEELRSSLREAFADSFKGMILYGSYARGDHDEGSDVDLLVLFEDKDAADRARAAVSELACEMLTKHGELVSAVPLGEQEYRKGRSPFYLNVKREGILIIPEEACEMKPEIDELLERAHDSLDAANDLFDSEREGYYRFTASRAYYAMFYAAEAALLSKGLSYSRHRGVVSGFAEHFTPRGASLHRAA